MEFLILEENLQKILKVYDFMEIEEFFSKLKRVYKNLNNDQKIMLRAKDFLQSTGKLFEKASQAKMTSKLNTY